MKRRNTLIVASSALVIVFSMGIRQSFGLSLQPVSEAPGDRYRKKYLLSIPYLSRAVVIGIFISLPVTNVSALLFGGTIGLIWLANVPLTSGIVAQLFGTRYLSTSYGVVFFSHQLGAFLGVWLGGRTYDLIGSYDLVWFLSIALGVVAAMLHTPISDKPTVSLQPGIS